eukprot:Polyplicarium_translucidae@DN2548_c0_g1_i2.p1
MVNYHVEEINTLRVSSETIVVPAKVLRELNVSVNGFPEDAEIFRKLVHFLMVGDLQGEINRAVGAEFCRFGVTAPTRVCFRCGLLFDTDRMNDRGQYGSENSPHVCCYHPQPVPPSKRIYSCCQQAEGTAGCTLSRFHETAQSVTADPKTIVQVASLGHRMEVSRSVIDELNLRPEGDNKIELQRDAEQFQILVDFMKLGDLPCQPTDLLKAEFRHFGVPLPAKRCAQCRKYYDPDRSKSRFERRKGAAAFACQYHPVVGASICICCLQGIQEPGCARNRFHDTQRDRLVRIGLAREQCGCRNQSGSEAVPPSIAFPEGRGDFNSASRWPAVGVQSLRHPLAHGPMRAMWRPF